MPKLDGVVTKEARQVWKSPDGQRILQEVVLEYQGQELKAKTYSSAIAVAGWTGEVETEERPGKFGPETYVKQPPKENPGYGGGTQSGNQSASTGSASGTRSFGSKPMADPFTMYLSYAKDLAVARMNVLGADKAPDYTDLLDQTIAGAYQLYNARPDADNGAKEPAQPPVGATKSLENVFNVPEPVNLEDSPWPTPNR